MGTAAASAGAAGPSEGLRAGRRSWGTKPENTAASGRHDHATFGSGPMRQSDVRDSEPDYLLRSTRHGPGGTLLDSIAIPLNTGLLIEAGDRKALESDRSTASSSQVGVILNLQ